MSEESILPKPTGVVSDYSSSCDIFEPKNQNFKGLIRCLWSIFIVFVLVFIVFMAIYASQPTGMKLGNAIDKSISPDPKSKVGERYRSRMTLQDQTATVPTWPSRSHPGANNRRRFLSGKGGSGPRFNAPIEANLAAMEAEVIDTRTKLGMLENRFNIITGETNQDVAVNSTPRLNARYAERLTQSKTKSDSDLQRLL